MSKILVIDDDKSFVRACEMILRKEGHIVASANSISDARTRLLSTRYDFVLLDVYLGHTDDGILFLEEIRSSELISDQKTIVLSGVRNRADALACQSLNATDYIHKEGDFTLLRKNILDAMEKNK